MEDDQSQPRSLYWNLVLYPIAAYFLLFFVLAFEFGVLGTTNVVEALNAAQINTDTLDMIYSPLIYLIESVL